ncbi:hypothetical protein Hanom_Chr12g01107101 [Helianthus anomalus]
MHMHAENVVINPNVVEAAGPFVSVQNVDPPLNSVGPSGFVGGIGPSSCGLGSVNGPLKSKGIRKSSLGPKQRKGKAQAGSSSSPGDSRPLKRTRRTVEEQEEGFGFVGFTSNLSSVPGRGESGDIRNLEDIDLNVDASDKSVRIDVSPGFHRYG